MSHLPDFDVIMWISYSDFGKKLEQEILATITLKPYEISEANGVLDIHWGFSDWKEAVSFLKTLRGFTHNPNVILLKASNHEDMDASIVLKDERYNAYTKDEAGVTLLIKPVS